MHQNVEVLIMERKIEKMEIVEVAGGSSFAHELRIHITFNEEAVEFLTLNGRYFDKDSRTVLHTLSLEKEVYDGDEYQRNAVVADRMRRVKSDYEDILELKDVEPSKSEGKDITGFCLCIDTDKLLDASNVALAEEAPPPPEPEEDPV